MPSKHLTELLTVLSLSSLLLTSADAVDVVSKVSNNIDSNSSLQQNQQQQQQQPRLQVAFACPSDADSNELPALVWLGGRWHSEPRLTGCVSEPARLLEFCRLAYPHVADIVNVAPSSQTVTVPNWCPVDANAACSLPRTVTPQLCLTSKSESDALFLPPNCRFDHRSADNPRDSSECRPVSGWTSVAEARCRAGGRLLRTHSPLLPCREPGQFAGVEFVCCPKEEAAASAGAEDRDKEILQRYLALATEPSVSESERFAQASSSLDRINQAKEAGLESRLASEENRIFDGQRQQAKSARGRLVSDIMAHYRRAFKSLEREETAEREQLDSVHEDRLSNGVRASLLRLRQLLSNAIDAGKRAEALGYLTELVRFSQAEAARLANQAASLATNGQLTAQRLESTKTRLVELRQQVEKARQQLGGQSVLQPLDALRHAEIAVDNLTPSVTPDQSALVARFVEILRRHAANDKRRLGLLDAEAPPPPPHHPMMPDDRLSLMSHPHGLDSSSPSGAVSGVLGGFAALLLIGLVAMVIVRGGCCPRGRRWSFGAQLWGGRGGVSGGHGGYKLTLVDEQQQQQQPQPPQPQPPHNRHLANLQANGYENPTYKFFEG